MSQLEIVLYCILDSSQQGRSLIIPQELVFVSLRNNITYLNNLLIQIFSENT